MPEHGRPSLDFQHWRQEQEVAVAERIAETHRQQLQPKTAGQSTYFDSIQNKKITVCTGPAGTGKTLIACAKAVHYLQTNQVDRIVLSRPLVYCGKGYGFLPGELREKIEPLMRPMLDYLNEFLPQGQLERHLRDGTVKLCPLDDMRGSTWERTFLVCDEAQNAEYGQLHMLFTRFGVGSKFVVCGDISRTQIDLQTRGPNPLSEVARRFRAKGGHNDIGLVKLTRKDIVRDGIVQWLDEALGDEVVEAWYSLKCPSCRAKLWYSNGDESDATLDDVESVQCYACNKAVDLFAGPDESPLVVDQEKGMVFAPTFPEKP